MAQFGVRVNGVPKFQGTIQATAYNLNAGGGLANSGGNTVIKAQDNGAYLQIATSQVFVNSAQLTLGTNGTPDTFINRIAANRLQIYDNSTTAGTIRLGIPEFSPAASTFAQTATITNGPRAANPVHWLEVTFNNGASSGRIPIW